MSACSDYRVPSPYGKNSDNSLSGDHPIGQPKMDLLSRVNKSANAKWRSDQRRISR